MTFSLPRPKSYLVAGHGLRHWAMESFLFDVVRATQIAMSACSMRVREATQGMAPIETASELTGQG